MKFSTALLWFLGILVFVGVLRVGIFYQEFQENCYPDSIDIEVMKDIELLISTYLEKNGIPKSLEIIQSPKYNWAQCREIDKLDHECYFKKNNRSYRINLIVFHGAQIWARLKINSEKGRMEVDYVYENRKWQKHASPKIIGKTTGKCGLKVG